MFETKVQSTLGRSELTWRTWFKSEKELCAGFQKHLAELKLKAAMLTPEDGKVARDLGFIEGQFTAWSKDKTLFPNMFLAPAVECGITVSDALVQSGRFTPAFELANLFGEVCKILVSRRGEKYGASFERLLQLACFALCDSCIPFEASNKKGASEEIAGLGSQLAVLIKQKALGTYYDYRQDRLRQNQRPNLNAAEKVINVALARHFDRRLRSLLENNRPSVEEYVRENMPAVFNMALLGERSAAMRKEWKELLRSEGYENVLRVLEELGDLINADEVGRIQRDTRHDIDRAEKNNDLDLVVDLLNESALELKTYLYKEAQTRLRLREPRPPRFSTDARFDFQKAVDQSRRIDPDDHVRALKRMQKLWHADINNLDIVDWVAYLRAKTGNVPVAQVDLEKLKKKREPERVFATEWNLAVLAYRRKEEAHAYDLLCPLLDMGVYDEDLIMVVLALAMKLEDNIRFLSTVPKTLTTKYHPLAIIVAGRLNRPETVSKLLGQLFNEWRGAWQLPPVETDLSRADLTEIVNGAIVESQVEQAVAWLEARISRNPNWVPNRLELARLNERELQDVDRAFEILHQRFLDELKQLPRKQKFVDDACRDLLDLAKRNGRPDLVATILASAESAGLSADLLESISAFARANTSAGEAPAAPVAPDRRSAGAPDAAPRDPQLSEKHAWVVARFTEIRKATYYVKEKEAVETFCRILREISPQESGTVVDIIQVSTGIVETFASSDPNEADVRRVLHDRANDNLQRLNRLVTGHALSQHLVDIVTPFRQAFTRVVADMSRQAGIGPSIDTSIENTFIARSDGASTLVVRLLNTSQGEVSDVHLELTVDSGCVSVTGPRDRLLEKLGDREERFFNFPIKLDLAVEVPLELVFGLSIRASAEGFPKVDMGINKKAIPLKAFDEVVGGRRVPKIFKIGQPLKPADDELFKGRGEILDGIVDSFYGGTQRQRYFLDGIRRVGKTSILHFVAARLPSHIIPVLVNAQGLGLTGPINSAQLLFNLCSAIRDTVLDDEKVHLDLPPIGSFELDPPTAFRTFLSGTKQVLRDKTPLLMIDEFQEMLEAVARSGPQNARDTLVLDQLRAQLEAGNLNSLFTGSVRFTRLNEIQEHSIIGSLQQLPISFLNREGVDEVIRAGTQKWIDLPKATIDRIFELTGGYPWLVQMYGAEVIDLVNQERRTIVTPEDIEHITESVILPNPELFRHWWAPNQLGVVEEQFVEHLFRKHGEQPHVTAREFMENIHSALRVEFTRALTNLRACEVFDSTSASELRFRGEVLRRWLLQFYHDRQLRIADRSVTTAAKRGRTGVFVDHENLVKGIVRVCDKKGAPAPEDLMDRKRWFNEIFDVLWKKIEDRVGDPIRHKVAVAFWTRSVSEAILADPYYTRKFRMAQPEAIKLANAGDFKLADEIRREMEAARNEGEQIDHVIIVGADSDFSHIVGSLIDEGVKVQIWGGTDDIKREYHQLIGERNFVALDDVIGR